MRAIAYREYGGPDVLKLEQRPQPTAGKGEILIRVRAAEVTKSDCELRSFNFPVKWFALPLRLVLGIRAPRRQILGSYFSGVVESLGEGAERFAPGDEIFGTTRLRLGAYGEFLVLPESYTLSTKPAGLSFEEAAAVPLGGLNALHYLRLLQLRPGERLLINGAGGSIGSLAVQIAKAWGVRVTAVDAAHKEEMLRGLGADEFFDYLQTPLSACGKEFDAVFDMVPGSPYEDCMSLLSTEGRYATGNPTLARMVRLFISSLFGGKKYYFAFAEEKQEELDTLRDMLVAGEIRPHLDSCLDLAQAQSAHRRVESEQRVGMVVLVPGPEQL